MRGLTRRSLLVPVDPVYDRSQPLLGRSNRLAGSTKLSPKVFQLALERSELLFSRTSVLSGYNKSTAAVANGYMPVLLQHAESLPGCADRYAVLPRKFSVRGQLLIDLVLTCVDRL